MRKNMKWLAAIGLILVLLLSVCAAAADGVSETLNVSISVKGTPPATSETYTIRLTADGDFPMPTGAEGRNYDLKVTGAASASFPVISYDRVGIYTYSVTQVPGTQAGVKYDDSVFNVKVQVYNNAAGDGFEIVTAIRKRGNETKTPITFVNTYPTELVSKTVQKNWDDNDNQDGIRPDQLTATLTSSEGMEPVTVTLNAANNWTATVPDLPRFRTDTRTEITYTWAEGATVSTYSYAGTSTEGDVTTITNRHVPATISASVEKTWDDANNQDGIRPGGKTTLRVTLLANGTEKQQVYLSEETGWKATVTGLPKYEKGAEIKYTWEERNPPVGYRLTGNATGAADGGQLTTLVNTHATETTSATIIKNWNDADNQDGIRPASITATLSDGTEVTLNAENNWRATVDNLPRYRNGEEIVYTWTENSVQQGYTQTGISTDGTITTITNTHTPATKEVEIRKVWADEDNADGLRTPVTLVLTASANQSAVATYTWVVQDEETQVHTFTVPVYSNGSELTYTVDEQTVPEGYVKTVDNNTLTVTNTHAVIPEETVDIQITKSWADDRNRDGIRPANIVVQILQNGKEMNTVTLTGTGDLWSYTVTGLPKYTNDTENVYTIAELNVPGYTSSIQDYAITNTHAIETTNLTVVKAWNDNNNANGDRPAGLTVTLNADGTAIATAVLNAANNWTATINNLPVNENGQPIIYTWTEPAIALYTQTNRVTNGTVTTLTNTRNNPNGNNPTPSRLHITYRYTNGQEASPPVELMLNPGENYDVPSPVIPGYTPTLVRVQGTMPDHNVDYLVLYVPGEGGQVYIIDDFETPLGLGNVFLNIGDCIE